MKNRYLLPLLLLLGAVGPALAQRPWQPFRPGLTYQLNETSTPGDTAHAVRLVGAAVRTAGGDTVYRFEARTGALPGSLGAPVAQPGGGYSRVRPGGLAMWRSTGLFGKTLTVRPNGDFVLTAANGRALTLRPRHAVGQSWNAGPAGLTAQVATRVGGLVLGQADSVCVIAFSDGNNLVLSRNLGFFIGPALARYLSQQVPPATLTLTALPERRLGTPQLGALAAFDFRPGDVFVRRTDVNGLTCVGQSWTRDSVLSRVDSRRGDTVMYRIWQRTYARGCASTPGLGAPGTQTLVVTAATGGFAEATSQWNHAAPPPGPALSPNVLHLPAWRTGAYNNRPVQGRLNMLPRSGPLGPQTDSLQLYDAAAVDAGAYRYSAPGLGFVREYLPNFTTTETTLIGFRKGAETWGQLPTFVQLLPTRASAPAATTQAYPNPLAADAEALTVAFVLARPQAVDIRVLDALGRVVFGQTTPPLASGPQTVRLAAPLPAAGVYTVHLGFAAERRHETMKLLRLP